MKNIDHGRPSCKCRCLTPFRIFGWNTSKLKTKNWCVISRLCFKRDTTFLLLNKKVHCPKCGQNACFWVSCPYHPWPGSNYGWDVEINKRSKWSYRTKPRHDKYFFTALVKSIVNDADFNDVYANKLCENCLCFCDCLFSAPAILHTCSCNCCNAVLIACSNKYIHQWKSMACCIFMQHSLSKQLLICCQLVI